jgi:hypothetical protein
MWILSALGKRNEPGRQVLSALRVLDSHRLSPVDEIARSPAVWLAILALHVIADETCADLHRWTHEDSNSERFTFEADTLLHGNGSLANVPKFRAQVMPKLLTPSVGMTLRSFSNYLTVRRASEVEGNWYLLPAERTHFDRFNLLLIPWPKVIYPTDFRPVASKLNVTERENGTGQFEFSSGAFHTPQKS